MSTSDATADVPVAAEDAPVGVIFTGLMLVLLLAARAVTARRELLAEALADPDAERRPEVEALLQRLARELAGRYP